MLTDQERGRFIEWLLRDAKSNKELAEQAAKMSGRPWDIIAVAKLKLCDAEMLVAKELMSVEIQTIG